MCAKLDQTVTSLFDVSLDGNLQMTDRSGFYVHGEGPKGSDGCLVLKKKDLADFLALLRTAGATPILVQDRGVNADRLRNFGSVA
jgi:hypothetical protein